MNQFWCKKFRNCLRWNNVSLGDLRTTNIWYPEQNRKEHDEHSNFKSQIITLSFTQAQSPAQTLASQVIGQETRSNVSTQEKRASLSENIVLFCSPAPIFRRVKIVEISKRDNLFWLYLAAQAWRVEIRKIKIYAHLARPASKHCTKHKTVQ